ncbi:MAG: YfhO family protein [Anaerolineae bacterium]
MRHLNQLQHWLGEKPRRADLIALLVLTALWALYFWRVLTPNPADQVSLEAGDFSGQFYAFGAYQARRLLAGEVPLWNPYNYAGHPFLADTQSAVFYPPRLVTIVASQWLGGWSYAAIQAEAIAHYWIGSLLMYLFVRAITRSSVAGLVSAITIAYGGYLTGYPMLQLAVLEAGVWFPLALFGVHRASSGGETPGRWRPHWLALSALALGLSLLAGHPQTTLFMLYGLMAYLIHRAAITHMRPLPTLVMLAGTVGLGFGLAAVQVLPGLEYARLVARAREGFSWGAQGFPWWDLATIVWPRALSHWSPLYSGIAALVLAAVAIWRRQPSARFWGLTALVALILAQGGSTLVFHLAYLLAPGFTLFRGQERAAFLVAHSVAILAGLGVAALRSEAITLPQLGRSLSIAAAVAWGIAVQGIVIELATPQIDLYAWAQSAFFAALLTTAAWLLIGRRHEQAARPWWTAGLVGLIVFDLFSATMGTNFEPVPAAERTFTSALVDAAQYDAGLYRVDGFLGLGSNFGTLVGLQDIRGISPLEPAAIHEYFKLPQYRRHELLNVKYVFTDWLELEVPSTIVATDYVPYPIQLHRISDPLPRAWMVYQAMIAPDDAQALGWLADASFNPRTTVILDAEPPLMLPNAPQPGSLVTVSHYAPERLVLEVQTPADGMLVISELYYPGWQAVVDGQPAPILRANAGLRALALKAGNHTVEMVYRPLSYRIGLAGSMLSVAILLGTAASSVVSLMRARRSGGEDRQRPL